MAGPSSRLRAVAARAITATGSYRALRGPFGRVRGGFVLAYHNLPTVRFIEQITALAPSQPIALDELVERHAAGAPTGGLFAITFDDGVGETVRAIAAVAAARQWPVTFYLPTGYLDAPGGLPFQWLRAIERYVPPLRLELPGETLDLTAPGAVRVFAKRMTTVMHTRPLREYAPLLRAIATALTERRLVDPGLLVAPAAITWSEVEALARNPLVSFESHGVSHTALVALMPDELEQAGDALHAGASDAATDLAVVPDDVFGLTPQLLDHGRLQYHRLSFSQASVRYAVRTLRRMSAASSREYTGTRGSSASAWRPRQPRAIVVADR